MGQTLTHGVYLPDEGERNCYSGLAANWQILDNSVGTIAAHTSALAGKAPLVHTHTVSQITDFPAYGNTAGTICEGNDSRLSDARTPVAHTHTKSDVTDLFNSANTWTANQTIEGNVAREYILKSTSFEIGQAAPASGQSEIGGLYLKDKNNVNHSFIGTYEDANGSSYIRILLRSKFTNNAKSTTGTTQSCAVDLGLSATGDSFLKPTSSGINNLGTSTNKWATFNGVNPGALSLPDQNANSVNLSGNITVLDGSASNDLTQTVNGWLFIYIENTTGAYIRAYIGSGSGTRTIIRGVVDAEQSQIYIFAPIFANITVSVYVKATSIGRARFYPCLGNV